jgi:hypothetical protein
MRDERDLQLEEVARAGKRFVYEYDFGDDWQHEIVVESVNEDATATTPTCVDGGRADPLEDAGGPLGYTRLLRILANPRHREHDAMKEWAGDFDPAAFNLTEVNARLLQYRTPRRPRKSRARLSRSLDGSLTRLGSLDVKSTGRHRTTNSMKVRDQGRA